MLKWYQQGLEHKILASHKLNLTSSRSHTLFTISIQSWNLVHEQPITSKISLVDLAGSERIVKTGATGFTINPLTNLTASRTTAPRVDWNQQVVVCLAPSHSGAYSPRTACAISRIKTHKSTQTQVKKKIFSTKIRILNRLVWEAIVWRLWLRAWTQVMTRFKKITTRSYTPPKLR